MMSVYHQVLTLAEVPVRFATNKGEWTDILVDFHAILFGYIVSASQKYQEMNCILLVK